MLQKSPGSSLSRNFQLTEGIYHFKDQAYNGWFEEQYSHVNEPWSYSRRGGELYRHTFTIQQLREFCPRPSSLLELGCGSGLMTAQFAAFTNKLYAADVSLSAVKACKQKCDPIAIKHNCQMQYYVTTTPGLPFDDSSFEVVTLCDGMIGWWFTEEQKQAALKDTYRVVQKGGYVVLTDYTTPDQFADYIKLVDQSEFSIMKTVYIYDRPWYALESLAKKLPFKFLLQPVVASKGVAKLLHKAGSLVGPTASRHIIVIARKE
jgi:ubiquinone/menaquinone biosynthesis C-methylase UbiE